jgi:hypothetical protein
MSTQYVPEAAPFASLRLPVGWRAAETSIQHVEVPDHQFPALLLGRKTTLILPGRHCVAAGNLKLTAAGIPALWCMVDVHAVGVRLLRQVTDGQAQSEGAPTGALVAQRLKRIHPEIKPSDQVTIVQFRPPHPDSPTTRLAYVAMGFIDTDQAAGVSIP